jgi:hypothetical protein
MSCVSPLSRGARSVHWQELVVLSYINIDSGRDDLRKSVKAPPLIRHRDHLLVLIWDLVFNPRALSMRPPPHLTFLYLTDVYCPFPCTIVKSLHYSLIRTDAAPFVSRNLHQLAN